MMQLEAFLSKIQFVEDDSQVAIAVAELLSISDVLELLGFIHNRTFSNLYRLGRILFNYFLSRGDLLLCEKIIKEFCFELFKNKKYHQLIRLAEMYEGRAFTKDSSIELLVDTSIFFISGDSRYIENISSSYQNCNSKIKSTIANFVITQIGVQETQIHFPKKYCNGLLEVMIDGVWGIGDYSGRIKFLKILYRSILFSSRDMSYENECRLYYQNYFTQFQKRELAGEDDSDLTKTFVKINKDLIRNPKLIEPDNVNIRSELEQEDQRLITYRSLLCSNLNEHNEKEILSAFLLQEDFLGILKSLEIIDAFHTEELSKKLNREYCRIEALEGIGDLFNARSKCFELVYSWPLNIDERTCFMYRLAELYVKTGDGYLALGIFREVERMNPNYRNVRSKIDETSKNT